MQRIPLEPPNGFRGTTVATGPMTEITTSMLLHQCYDVYALQYMRHSVCGAMWRTLCGAQLTRRNRLGAIQVVHYTSSTRCNTSRP
eukprot:5923145-Pyramimonas_sp.AAC.1